MQKDTQFSDRTSDGTRREPRCPVRTGLSIRRTRKISMRALKLPTRLVLALALGLATTLPQTVLAESAAHGAATEHAEAGAAEHTASAETPSRRKQAMTAMATPTQRKATTPQPAAIQTFSPRTSKSARSTRSPPPPCSPAWLRLAC